MITNTFWTKERVAILIKRWAAGHSAGMIGREIGCARGAVSGKVQRLNLPKRVTNHSTNGWGMSRPRVQRQRAPAPRAAPVNPDRLNRSVPITRTQSNFVNHHRRTKAEMQEELRQAVLNTGGRE